MDTKKLEFGSDAHLTVLGAPWHLYLLTGKDREDMLKFGRACMDAAEDRRLALTDEQIDAIAEGMEGGMDGFLKGWGWRQFARAVESAIGLTLGVADTDMPFLAAEKLAEENKHLHALLDAKAKEHTALFLSARETAKDAARYCWLRDCAEQEIQFDHTTMEAAIGVLIPCRWTNDEPSLDAAIDARLAQLNKETQA